MASIELIYDSDCPNVEDARENLRRALSGLNLPARWTEWNRGQPDTPQRVRGFGSPTILVDGRDIADVKPGQDACCRIYETAGGRRSGVPPVALIREAIEQSTNRAAPVGGGWGRSLVAAPAVAISLLPSLTCPLCWPAYAALLSSVGLGFLANSAYLLPLTGMLLAVAVAGFGLQIRTAGYVPFILGLVSVGTILPGKFVMGSNLATYGGVALLAIASVWSLVSRRSTAARCSTCAPSGEGNPQPV
jgi:mercuric ion transport protein